MTLKLTRGASPRRWFGAVAVVAALALTACGGTTEGETKPSKSTTEGAAASSDDDLVLVASVRDISNPYHVSMIHGAQLFADTVGHELTVLANEGDSQKQMSQIQTLVASGKTIVLTVEAPTSSDARPIVQAVVDSGGYVVTLMNKTDDMWPWDVNDNWVSHISFDNVQGGYDISKALFDEMGGSGSIIALRGLLDTPTDQDRYEGFEKALEEYPDIEVLDVQTASFDRNEGFQVTQTLLNKHSGKVEGIWSSNDDMALGALQALTAAQLEGKVPLVSVDGTPEALDLIKAGTSGYIATISPDASWQGGASLSLAYQAATGKFDPAAAPHEQRAWNGEAFLVTKDNVDDFIKEAELSDLEDDFADPMLRNVGGIN